MTPNPQHVPGSWLRRFARLFFDADTLARVVDPTLADLAHEVREANDDPAARRAALLRGYLAFWKLVVLSPFAFSDWPGRRQFAQSLVHVGAIVVLLGVTFGARSAWMSRLMVGFYPRIPFERFISIADVAPYAWLLAPIVVVLLATFGRRSPFRVAPTAIVMICGATITVAAVYGTAGFFAVFSEIGRSGSAGLTSVLPGMDALVFPSLFALGITALMAIVLGISQWRGRDKSPAGAAAPAIRLSGTASLLLVVSMAASLVAVNRWLLMNETMIEVMMALTNPARAAAAGGNRVVAGQTEIGILLMLLGFVIAAAMLVMGLAAWGRSRSRRPSSFLAWSTRLAIVIMLVGCVWHAKVMVGQWQTFRAETAAMMAR